MVVVAHVVVVEVDEALNCLLHRGHLQERHFVISEENKTEREKETSVTNPKTKC